MITREQMRHDAFVFCAVGTAGLVASSLIYTYRIAPLIFVLSACSLALGLRVIALLRTRPASAPNAPDPTSRAIPLERPTLRLITSDPPDAA